MKEGRAADTAPIRLRLGSSISPITRPMLGRPKTAIGKNLRFFFHYRDCGHTYMRLRCILN